MTARLHPSAALYGAERPLPALPPCVHYAGSERHISKALRLQVEMGPVFDIGCDCEDGAPVGEERAHAKAMAALIAGEDNAFGRVGARIHDLTHHAWRAELDILVHDAGSRIAFLTLPKAESAADVERFLRAVRKEALRAGVNRSIPVSVMIETPGAVHDAWAIAALPGVVSLDFGTLDFVSAHRGAIPAAAMQSPGQFDHPLVRRAKCEVAAAALAHAGPGPSSAFFACGASTRRSSNRSCARSGPIRRRSRPRQQCSPRRKTPTGDRFATTASSTTARRTVTAGKCCSAPTAPARPYPLPLACSLRQKNVPR